jgi:hypothetical protein
MTETDDRAEQKSWTALKLDWLRCLAVDSQIKPGMFETAFAIIQHVNAKTRVAILSDQTISDATSISIAEVYRHRQGLRTFGWLTWTRSRTASRYSPQFDRMNAMLDEIEDRRQRREASRIERFRQAAKGQSRFIAGDETEPRALITDDGTSFITDDETGFIAGDEHTPSLNTFTQTPSHPQPPMGKFIDREEDAA